MLWKKQLKTTQSSSMRTGAPGKNPAQKVQTSSKRTGTPKKKGKTSCALYNLPVWEKGLKQKQNPEKSM